MQSTNLARYKHTKKQEDNYWYHEVNNLTLSHQETKIIVYYIFKGKVPKQIFKKFGRPKMNV